MGHFAGIDVSLERSSVCVVDATGRIVREAKVRSGPEALVAFLAGLGVAVTRVGLEAGPLSHWLHAGLTAAGHETVLLETRHVKAALAAMAVKTDRRGTRAASRSCCGWAGTGRCTASPRPRRSCGRCSRGGRCSSANRSTWSCRSAGSCAASA